jgi:hypothetical protein
MAGVPGERKPPRPWSLRDLGPEVVVPEPVLVAALRPIEKMLSLS